MEDGFRQGSPDEHDLEQFRAVQESLERVVALGGR
jgi:hypothetical protein